MPMPSWVIRALYPPQLSPPRSTSTLIEALHHGGIVALQPTERSLALCSAAGSLIHCALDSDQSWTRARKVTNPFERLAHVKEALTAESHFLTHIAHTCRALGMDPDTLVTGPRLRVITAGIESRPGARPAFLAHRDTWYGYPQSMLVAWLPLHPVAAEEVFAFFPEYFSRPVANSSSEHDPAWWSQDTGAEGRTGLQNFAAPTEPLQLGRGVRWGLDTGSILLFSAAQLHQSQPNPTPGDTRYSLDFRILPVGPTEAPNVDNASTGEASRVAEEFSPIREFL